MADLSSLFENDTVESLAEGHYSSEELLVPGWYKVAIVGEQIKDTSSGGKMLVFECQLDSGSKVNDNFNLVNPNPEAVRIAKSTPTITPSSSITHYSISDITLSEESMSNGSSRTDPLTSNMAR